VVADPFGSSMCLIIAGLIFSRYLYKLNIITLGDFYRMRYNRTVEVITTICIVLSYLGWVAAQIKALGLIFFVVTRRRRVAAGRHDPRRRHRADLHRVRRHVLGGDPRLRADGGVDGRPAVHRLDGQRKRSAVAPRRCSTTPRRRASWTSSRRRTPGCG
jgi:hypothetical protein